MEHADAIRTHAAEGYLLGDLDAAEYAAFEEHFADCDACFTQVRDGATVIAATRTTERARHGLRDYLPTLAAAASIAVLVGVVGYQRMELTRLRAPHLTQYYELKPGMRGAQVKPVEVDGSAAFELDFDIAADPSSPRGYTCTIVDAQGKTRYRVPVSAQQASQMISLGIPAGSLPPGHYSLIVSGAEKAPAFKSEFTVR